MHFAALEEPALVAAHLTGLWPAGEANRPEGRQLMAARERGTIAIAPLPRPGAGEFPHRSKQAEHAYDEQSNRQDGYFKERVRAWVVRPDSEIPEEPAPRKHHQQAYRTECDLISPYREADVPAGHVDPPNVVHQVSLGTGLRGLVRCRARASFGSVLFADPGDSTPTLSPVGGTGVRVGPACACGGIRPIPARARRAPGSPGNLRDLDLE